MANKKTIHSFDVYTISSNDGRTRASFVPEKGGAGSSIIMPDGNQERELLFLHDYFWQKELPDLPGGWPFLFPICARLQRNGQMGAYLYDGHIYHLPIHGFSWRSAWEVVDANKSDQITLLLRDNKETLAMYPFSFAIKLTYKVAHNKLICEQTYTNKSQQPMPYYAGFHPYFLTPLPNQGKEKVLLDYQPERWFFYNKDYTDLIGEKSLFKLPVAITQAEINETITKVGENKEVKLIYPNNFILHLNAEGINDPNLFSYVQLYTMPNKPFFCVEPWMAFPNALNTVSGVRWLQPGESESGLLLLTADS